jgi:hypothetical protein
MIFVFIFSPHFIFGVRVVWMLPETVMKQFLKRFLLEEGRCGLKMLKSAADESYLDIV